MGQSGLKMYQSSDNFNTTKPVSDYEPLKSTYKPQYSILQTDVPHSKVTIKEEAKDFARTDI